MRQGCSLSPAPFNIYINELAVQPEQSAAPGLARHDTEVKFLLCADDLVLPSPAERGLQKNLTLLQEYCLTRALAVNLKRPKIRPFYKKARCQEHIVPLYFRQHCARTHLKLYPPLPENQAIGEL